MLKRESLVALMNFSRLIAKKNLKETLSQLCGWVNIRITIAVARLYSRMIPVACLTSPLRDQETEWDPGLGLGLVKLITCYNNFARKPVQICSPTARPRPSPPCPYIARALSLAAYWRKFTGTRTHTFLAQWKTEGKYWRKDQGNRRMKQGWDRNQT